jgi:hypothetical protein
MVTFSEPCLYEEYLKFLEVNVKLVLSVCLVLIFL